MFGAVGRGGEVEGGCDGGVGLGVGHGQENRGCGGLQS